MPGKIETRLAELEIELPVPQETRVAKILPSMIIGQLLYVSGMVPQWNGDLRFIGKVGREFTLEEGQASARLSTLNVLAQAHAALDGDLDELAGVATRHRRARRRDVGGEHRRRERKAHGPDVGSRIGSHREIGGPTRGTRHV